jgi:acetoin utilization deacetylase AcuC-like enzyme
MKVIFHEKYTEVYAHDPAAQPGRMEAIYRVLEGAYEFEEPIPATDGDLKLCHTRVHIESLKEQNPSAYSVGKLAVGGAGFCYFNNMGISIKRLLKEGKIKRAVILDIDLHYRDGKYLQRFSRCHLLSSGGI